MGDIKKDKRTLSRILFLLSRISKTKSYHTVLINNGTRKYCLLDFIREFDERQGYLHRMLYHEPCYF